LSLSKTNALCFGGFGSATVIATGGTIPYSYSWNSVPEQTSETADLLVGTWTVTITDGNGCTKSSNVTIELNSCEGFTTITQGGYGAKCSGNNWGCYLKNNFAATFPTGIKIGTGTRLIKFTTVAAI
jgi:SprB repeat